jgi:hypothetical protein
MSQQELLRLVVRTLDNLGIHYMLTGSIVSSLQGEPRTTHDIDIVINLPPTHARSLAAAFPAPAFYLDEAAVIEAVSTHGMANLIETESGDRVDFWLLTEDPFDRSRFSRRCHEEILGMRIAVSKPEDTILAKLRWARLSGGSAKQFLDALRVYEVQYEKLDLAYLREWGARLGIMEELERLLREAAPA